MILQLKDVIMEIMEKNTANMLDLDECQEPTGLPYRKDSFIYTGFPDSSPKCLICGENADILIMYGINKWICYQCNVPVPNGEGLIETDYLLENADKIFEYPPQSQGRN
jgi:hypothetical protein